MYYLYHIKGVKWGCTKNLEQRLKKQGYSITDCSNIITIGNIDKASDMERELNLQYGYKWIESQDYRIITKAQTNVKKESRSKGGINAFVTNTKKGNMKEFYSKGGLAITSVIKECPYCSKQIKQPAIYMHIKKCKLIVK